MKSLADLKRDLVIGSSLTLVSRYGKTEGKNIGIKRFVVKKNTVGLCLNADKNATKGAFLDWPKASLLKYDGDTITIHISGFRLLTSEEKQIIKNQPRDDEQDKIDIMTDGSTMFYRRKVYFLKIGKIYLFGCKSQAGKYLKSGTTATARDGSFSDWFIRDDNVKGEIGLVYKIN